MSSFNSKLVRLEARKIEADKAKDVTFQFQTGAIRSEGFADVRGARWQVSIPNWCD